MRLVPEVTPAGSAPDDLPAGWHNWRLQTPVNTVPEQFLNLRSSELIGGGDGSFAFAGGF